MARRIRALSPDRVDVLPGPCACCALWEGGSLSDLECGHEMDREKLVAWISRVRSEWGDCGRVAFEDGEPLGLVKYAPPRYFRGLSDMPTGLPDDDAVLIACLRVSGEARHAGLGKVLLQAALRDLSSRSEKVVEAYAAADPLDREHSPLMSVEFLLRQGFTVSRPHPRYPLMRLELRSLVAWTDNIEAVLEALQLPRRVTERVPASLAAPTDGARR
jgi:GNAT superfamily N-acetyltransferase